MLYIKNKSFSAFSPSKLLRLSAKICPAALMSCSLATLVGGADRYFKAALRRFE